jgi:hypothetical protein
MLESGSPARSVGTDDFRRDGEIADREVAAAGWPWGSRVGFTRSTDGRRFDEILCVADGRARRQDETIKPLLALRAGASVPIVS